LVTAFQESFSPTKVVEELMATGANSSQPGSCGMLLVFWIWRRLLLTSKATSSPLLTKRLVAALVGADAPSLSEK
jgi:hypothetical protein